jgi:hypothetical protein
VEGKERKKAGMDVASFASASSKREPTSQMTEYGAANVCHVLKQRLIIE